MSYNSSSHFYESDDVKDFAGYLSPNTKIQKNPLGIMMPTSIPESRVSIWICAISWMEIMNNLKRLYILSLFPLLLVVSVHFATIMLRPV